jgi:hypothetical protein
MKLRFNIGGAFAQSNQLIMFFHRNKENLNRFDITVYDGISNCSWNGGRINRDITYTDEVINFYYRNNISIALTFSNPIVDLDDKTGNELLQKFHKEGNYIISINDKLREYIRASFPKYKHTRSITGFGDIDMPMSDKDFNRYKNLEDKYDSIVPRSEHVFDKRFKDLSVNRYEIMLNDTCIYGCPYYGEHFEKIAEQNRLYRKPWKEGGHDEMYEVEECWLSDRSTYLKCSSFNPDIGHLAAIKKHGEDYGMDLTTKQIERLIQMGVYNFKLTGREMKIEDYEHELNSYLNPFILHEKAKKI